MRKVIRKTDMKNIIKGFLSSAIIIFLTSAISAKEYIPSKYIRDKNKPVLVMFTASWCQPCGIMKNIVFKEAGIKKRLERLNVLFFDIDTEEGKHFSEIFRDTGFKGSIPFFVLLDTHGQPLASLTGAAEENDFAAFLDKALKGTGDENALKMICIGSEKYVQCLQFFNDLDSIAELKSVSDSLSMAVTDPDDPDDPYSEYDYISTVSNTCPTFVFTNPDGDVVAGIAGYYGHEDFMNSLDRLSTTYALDVPYKEVLHQSEKHRKIIESQKKYDRLVVSGWRIDAGISTNVSFLSGNNPLKNMPRTGYGISVAGRRILNKAGTVSFNVGLSFDSWGGRKRSTERPEYIREYLLRLPLEIETDLFTVNAAGFPLEIKFRAGLWGAWIPGHTLSVMSLGNGMDMNSWDAGVTAAIALQAGSFDMTFGYSRGFIDQFSGENGFHAYNNAFLIGIAVNIGD